MGTLLFGKGVQPGECPEKINLSHPEILAEIAKLYLDAGAEMIQTNTFGASPIKLAMYQLHEQTVEICEAGVRAVREAVGDRAYVSASCGPCGKMLTPYGDTEPEAVRDSFQIQIAAMNAADADILCIETMTDLAEATLAIEAARIVSNIIPIVATMTFDPTSRGFHTIMGVSVEAATNGLLEAGADVIGSNCGNSIENMIEIAEEFRGVTNAPLIIQSNAGLPETRNGLLVYPESPEFMAEKAVELAALGVNIIGGCCGTTPEHIKAIRNAVNPPAEE